MKHFLKCGLAFFLWALCAGVAQAGEWELLRYERNAQYYNQDIATSYGYDPNSDTSSSYHLIYKHSNRSLIRWRGEPAQEQVYLNGQPVSGFYTYYPQSVTLGWNSHPSGFKGPSTRGVQVATSSGKLAITPVFRWKRAQVWNSLFQRYEDDSNDHPPKELFYVEYAAISGSEGVEPWSNELSPYPQQGPFKSKYFTFKSVSHPFGETTQSVTLAPYGWAATHYFSVPNGNQRITRIGSGGKDEVRGETRSFNAQIDLTAAYGDGGSYNRYGSAVLNFSYSATPSRFALNVSADAFASFSVHPRAPHLGAYAAPGVLGRYNVEAATTPFWGGSAGYSTSLAPSLLETLGTPTYAWSSSSPTYHSQQHQNGLDPSLWTGQPDPKELVGTSTPEKQFDHDLGKLSEGSAARTQVKVKITGSNAQKSKLTAKATIDWYRRPSTRLRSETYVLVHDYESGTTTRYDSVESLLKNMDEDQQQIDEYIAEIQAAYKETVSTGAELVGTALEVEKAVGSWYVPDETDVALFVVGGVAKRVFKVARNSTKFMAIVAKVGQKITAKSDHIIAVMANKLKHSNFAVEVRQKLIAETRVGHAGSGIKSNNLPPGHAAHEAEGQVIEDVPVCSFGSGDACFVAGTLVPTDNGLRAIETIRKGDLVWSRDAQTGTTELKRVKQTFKRHSATLALTLSDGEKIETTKEHPFYVEGQGFVPAGEMGIGTSIVTRAGPSVQLVSAQAKEEVVSVFNFEVEGFHTYFVGLSQAWVHNACWSTSDPAANAFSHWKKHRQDFPHLNNALEYAKEAKGFLDNPPASALVKYRANGDKVVYDPASDLFGVWDSVSNAPRTYYKPDPALHGYPTNLDYFNAQ